MSVFLGEKLGPYEILALIGKGGMGEVYRARDPRLNRDVAIKVSDAQFSECFAREAQAIAALNHPNICQIYDVGPNYLVMEYIEGAPVKGPLPLGRAVEYAGQILDALDTAHKKGIIHRDLKPANILMTKQGIKLLDFGLAKQTGPIKQADATVTRGLTGQGQILGTLQYMSPEQLQSKQVDTRSDLFSFGCVLYEILTGKRAFEGSSAASVIAAILEREPAPLNLSPPLERLIRTCLAKDPEERIQTARDVKKALNWAVEPQIDGIVIRRGSQWLWIAMVAALLLGAALFLSPWFGRGKVPGEVVSFAVYPPEKTAFSNAFNITLSVPQFALSPDGRVIVFAAGVEGERPLLWRRPLGDVVAQVLPGTEDAQDPFWSPDSRWVGFFAEGKLKKIPATGGAVQVVVSGVFDVRGGAWGTDDTILFATATGSIQRVPAAGGDPTPAATVTQGENASHRYPQFLPDGRHFLYLAPSPNDRSGLYAGSLDDQSAKLVLRIKNSAVYTGPGYLLFVDGDTVFGQAFDAVRLEASGQPFLIGEHAGRSSATKSGISASSTGAIAYSETLTQNGRLTWFDRAGRLLDSTGPKGYYTDFRLSPSEKLLSASLLDLKTGTIDVWITDLARGNNTRVTSGGGSLNASPIWSPEGAQFVFRSNRGGAINQLYQRSAGGGGGESLVLPHRVMRAAGVESGNLTDTDWSPDGQSILFSVTGTASGTDLWLLPLSADKKPVKYLAEPWEELQGNFSPNGNLVAYTSNESGKYQVYVQTLPLSDRKWQVSTDGGYEPRWRADGREIYYLSADRKLMAVPVRSGPFFDSPKALFQTRVPSGITANRMHYVPSRDGQRFLVNTQSGEASPAPITVMLNWQAGLKK
jgi:Tol biopolymer transport system component/predicted Ser/Thr protein kinase